MAVTFTATELAAALRLGDSSEELVEVTRLLDYASEAVDQYAPDASDAAHTEACRRLCGYLYDMPEAGRYDAYANAMRNSGAGRVLLPFRVHRAGPASDDDLAAAQQAVGTTGNPVVDVTYLGDLLTVTYSDGATEEFTVAGGSGVDQTARAAAAAAQARADDAYTKAEGAETTAEDAEATAETTETGLEGHIAQHPGAVHGGPPAAFEATRLTLELDLTSSYIEAFVIPASNFTAGAKYRITSTSFARGIGNQLHILNARLFLGTVVLDTAVTAVDPEGSSQGKWAGTLERIVTMPDPAVAISVSYSEGGFVRIQTQSSLIAMEVS